MLETNGLSSESYEANMLISFQDKIRYILNSATTLRRVLIIVKLTTRAESENYILL